jgi:MSHA biogenesis protein MshK
VRKILIASLLILAIAKVASAQTFRDPMRPAGAAPAPASVRASAPAALRLEGVINGAERFAIVSGRVVRAGDQVLGATILEIFPNGVRLSRAGKVQTLTLPAEPVIGSVRVARSVEAKASEAKKP